MRVLFTTWAQPTHFHGMVPLAWALRAAGHDVRVASQPALVPTIVSAGLPAVPTGVDHVFGSRPTTPVVDRDHPLSRMDFDRFHSPDVPAIDLLGMYTIMVPGLFAPVNDGMLDGLVAEVRTWAPDLVVWEPMTFSGALAAAASGVPHVRLLWGPDVLGRARATMLDRLAELPEEVRDDPLGEWLSWHAEALDVPWSESLTTGGATIETEVPSARLDTGLDRISMRYVPYNGPAEVPGWLSTPPSRPRVCITTGVSARHGLNAASSSAVDLAEELADLDVEVVVTATPDQVGDRRLPASVRVVDFVPMDQLLPTCAAVVHHGGAGTWSTALVHGVPQVVLGESWDAAFKARRIEELRAGRRVDPRAPAVAVGAAVRAVLSDPSVRDRAAGLQAEMLAQPSPADVVGVLTDVVAAERGN